MLFSSFTFIFVFLPIVWVVFHLLKKARFKSHYKSAKIFLIFSSLFFYAFWKVAYLPILLSSIIVNYFLARLILKQSLMIKANATTLGGGGIAIQILINSLFYDSPQNSISFQALSLIFVFQVFSNTQTFCQRISTPLANQQIQTLIFHCLIFCSHSPLAL